jgi:hypothetical protein
MANGSGATTVNTGVWQWTQLVVMPWGEARTRRASPQWDLLLVSRFQNVYFQAGNMNIGRLSVAAQ